MIAVNGIVPFDFRMPNNAGVPMSAEKKNSYPFATRWRLEGVLKTRTPLYIGSGITTKRDKLRDEKKNLVAILPS